MNGNLPYDCQNVLVQHPETFQWEWAYFCHEDSKWWKGVEENPDDIELDYAPAQWKLN